MKQKNRNRPVRRIRQEEAAERKIRHENLSPQEQLAILDTRPGESKKERKKLEKRIAKGKS